MSLPDEGLGLRAGTAVSAVSEEVPREAPSAGSVSVDSSGASPLSELSRASRVWLFVDLEMFKAASGLSWLSAQVLWARWVLRRHALDGLWGKDANIKIAVELEVLRHAPSCDESVTVSDFARGAGCAPASPSGACVWLYFDFELFERASGFHGRQLQSTWARWWVLAESRGHICGTDEAPTIGLQLNEVLREV